MTSLWLTIPLTLLLAGTLVALVVRAARRGDFDDWEGPAARMLFDDDTTPEHEGTGPAPHAEAAPQPRPRAPGTGGPDPR